MKKIKEFMAQAGLEPYYDAQQTSIDKFAELLIKEACRIVNIWSDEEPCDDESDVMAVYKLKEYFGIKEDEEE